ncbi:MAG: transketolase C-terminal domain-containing protein [Planctomycetota bacterium]|jgi:pyruvate ferredoxin oxidoreductase alpha subunit|nr:transketolase C-terminal domain-containing protein [Planctomycetota bacterium]MDP7134971.1 transketolase C-terminal domain-containing protein [Planctomycetota bacterium]
MNRLSVIEGSMAVAEAVRACRPSVISAYPISPQTHIIESLSQMAADGVLDCEFVRADSEFSAASIVYGASATGVRAYTASSSQGLLLMTEVIYNTAGTRLPIVMTGVNRAVSTPVSIQVDQQDTISLRDTGMLQLYVESSQEAYDTHIQAFRISEDPDVLLPVMVCMDGWILTHNYEPVATLEQEAVDSFLPPFQPSQYLTPEKPLTYGSYAEDDVMMEFKFAVHDAQLRALDKIEQAAGDFKAISGRWHGGLIEEYETQDAEVLLVAMGAVVGTIKDAVDELRAEGEKVGLIKVRSYRPFPAERIRAAASKSKVLAVLDANVSMGSEGALALDVKSALCNSPGQVVQGFIAGLGGKEVNKESIRDIVAQAKETVDKGPIAKESRSEWIGLNREIV